MVKIRKVTGCGKHSGFQLVIDSQRMKSLLPTKRFEKGFKVFVTLPGVVTSKVPFEADPTYHGEHNFYIHGIHAIKVFLFFQTFLSRYSFRSLLQGRL